MPVELNEAVLVPFFNAPDGPVGIYLDSRAQGVLVRAANNARGDGLSGRPHRRTGRLAASIRTALLNDPEGLVAQIGTDVRSPRQDFPYGLALEAGMPGPAGPLPPRQPQGYRYPFLEPALNEEFGRGI